MKAFVGPELVRASCSRGEVTKEVLATVPVSLAGDVRAFIEDFYRATFGVVGGRFRATIVGKHGGIAIRCEVIREEQCEDEVAIVRVEFVPQRMAHNLQRGSVMNEDMDYEVDETNPMDCDDDTPGFDDGIDCDPIGHDPSDYDDMSNDYDDMSHEMDE